MKPVARPARPRSPMARGSMPSRGRMAWLPTTLKERSSGIGSFPPQYVSWIKDAPAPRSSSPEIWRTGKLPQSSIPTPSVSGGILYLAGTGMKGGRDNVVPIPSRNAGWTKATSPIIQVTFPFPPLVLNESASLTQGKPARTSYPGLSHLAPPGRSLPLRVEDEQVQLVTINHRRQTARWLFVEIK